jgi:hypothetical protein
MMNQTVFSFDDGRHVTAAEGDEKGYVKRAGEE